MDEYIITIPITFDIEYYNKKPRVLNWEFCDNCCIDTNGEGDYFKDKRKKPEKLVNFLMNQVVSHIHSKLDRIVEDDI